MYEKYALWIVKNKPFVTAVKALLLDPDGAEFPTVATSLTGENAGHVKTYLGQRAEYLEMGRAFLVDVAGAKVPQEARRELLVASEADGHLFHNAAVLWLEDNPAATIPDVLDYEECLKSLWFDEVLRADTGRVKGSPSAREKALLLYCFGADRPAPLPMGHKDLAAARTAAHVTLGKVIARDHTRFHDDGAIRVHPGFWGLFLFSPTNTDHKGSYAVEKGSTEERWLHHLTTALDMDHKLVHDAPEGRFQVYERAPRLFADTALTPPGVFLHRSRAHGRDDFLVKVSGADAKTRKVMVACTKGVGLQPDCVPKDIGDLLSCLKAFSSAYGQGTRNLPFTYPKPGENDRDSSWRNMGFCLVRGDDHDEIATVDFANFRSLYEKAAKHRLHESTKGFVEPFVCVEMSCLPHNVERMPEVAAAVESNGISWPAQVVTVSERETSLRLFKEGRSQDYDYANTALELLEWERAFAGSACPEPLLVAVRQDARTLAEKLPTVIRELFKQKHVDAAIQAVPASVALLERRMLVGARALCSVLASWTVFVENDLGSDTYTGSFSGRNFNSGPRDSNEWGPFSRGSVRADQSGPAGGGLYSGHVDIGNLLETLGTPTGKLFGALGLVPTDDAIPSIDVQKGTSAYEESMLILLGANTVWKESALYRVGFELARYFNAAKVRLDEIAKKKAPVNAWGGSLPVDDQVVLLFRTELDRIRLDLTKVGQSTPALALVASLLPTKP